MNFLASPEIVTAMAFSGELSFNPTKDTLIGSDGTTFQFAPPEGSMLPSEGFTPGSQSEPLFYIIALIDYFWFWSNR